MSSFSSPSLSARVLIVAALALSCVGLTGCTPAPSPSQSPNPSASQSQSPSTPSPSPSETPSAAPSPAPSASPIPVNKSCDELISPQAMYDFNPNFGLQSDYTPKAGTPAATALAKKGVACSWLNQTSRDTIELSVANLPPAEIDALKAKLDKSSSPVSAFAAPGYFTAANGIGLAQAFDGTFWVTARSSFFVEAGDAAQMMDAALGSLR